jgi:hypothetical protein
MTLDSIANLAEIMSGIIVVITLIFLVMQIRANTKALRATAIENYYDGYLDLAADVNRVSELATAMQKAFANQPLDAMDNHHLCTLVQRLCSIVERGLIMVQDGVLDREDFNMATLPAKMVLGTSAARHWYYFLKNERGLFRPELHQWAENFYVEQDRQGGPAKTARAPGAADGDIEVGIDVLKTS